MSYKAEYIWVDGQKPTAKMRSKGKVIPDGEEPPIWAFDGSSTNQATGDNSDCVLNPVFVCPDPIRRGDNKLVMCEVLLTDMTPHPSNTRAPCAASANKYSAMDMWFGIEQEYTYFDGIKPLGWPDNGFPAPQGGYYCGVGSDEVFGRPIVEEHLDACMYAGLAIAGAGIGAATLMPQSSNEKTAQSAETLQTASFAVENMTCATCPITVRRAMEGVAGVHDVTIDYEAKTATAHFDPAKTTMRDIATASTEVGYPAQTQFSGTDL